MQYEFPQYRMLSNGMSYYRIDSMTEMTELQRLGTRWITHTLIAKIHPERMFILDLLNNEGGQYQTITAEEFQKILNP